MPKLIKLNADYSDEFDVNCFAVLSDEDFEIWGNKLLSYNERIEFYFGSNEWLEWDNGLSLFRELNISDISVFAADFLSKTFPATGNSLGVLAEFGVASGIFTDDTIFTNDEI